MANTFIFSWDMYGIESIVPITEYEQLDKENLLLMIAGCEPKPNPLNNIVRSMLLRASANQQRHYEIYSVACDDSIDEKFWHEQWEKHPQRTASLIRKHGHKIYSDRVNKNKVKIT